MNREELDCKIPMILLLASTIIINGVMTWLVWVRKKVVGRFRIMIINVGVINLLFVITNITRISMYDTFHNDKYFTALTRSFFKYTRWVRFFVIVWIAVERLLAVWQPIKFKAVYSHYSKVKIIACIWLVPLLYVSISGFLQFGKYSSHRVNLPLYLHGLMLISLVILYAGIQLGITGSFRSVASSSETANQIRAARISHEKKSLIFAFGINGTFIVCNLLAVVTEILHDTNLPLIAVSCNTRQSSMTEAANFMLIIDILVDPIWYYFGHYFSNLSRKKTPSRRIQQNRPNLKNDPCCLSEHRDSFSERKDTEAKPRQPEDVDAVSQNKVHKRKFTVKVSSAIEDRHDEGSWKTTGDHSKQICDRQDTEVYNGAAGAQCSIIVDVVVHKLGGNRQVNDENVITD